MRPRHLLLAGLPLPLAVPLLVSGWLASTAPASFAASSVAAPDAAGTVPYEVNPTGSTAGFTLKATGHTVEGTGGKVSGKFRRAAAPSEGAYAMEGEIRIDAASLQTGNSTRDRKMRRDTLAVDQYPQIQFKPRRAKLPAADQPPAQPPSSSMTLEGDLTIRNTTHPVSIPVTVRIEGRRATVEGSLRLNFLDYGVPDPSFFILRVSPEMTVRFHLEATQG